MTQTIFAIIAFPNLTTVGQVAIFLAVLGVLVIVHEFGHFIFAKRFGVRVSNFAVGFGPTIWQTTRGETTYRVNLLPLGGYCQMVGEDEADDGSADPGNFQHKPLWQRFIIIVAGPLVNLLLATIIFAYLATSVGIPNAPTNVVERVTPNSPAERAGLVPGDAIEMLNGQAFKSGGEIVDYIHARPNTVIEVDILHGGTIRHLQVKTTTMVFKGQTVGIFGFSPRFTIEHTSLTGGIVYGFLSTGAFIWANATGLVDTITHRDASAVLGPVGIGRAFVSAEKSGFVDALDLIAKISALLGFFNLLPLPALDGGRLAFLLVEFLRGRPVDPAKEGLVHLTGFAIFMVLILFVTYHDVAQWVSGKGGL